MKVEVECGKKKGQFSILRTHLDETRRDLRPGQKIAFTKRNEDIAKILIPIKQKKERKI